MLNVRCFVAVDQTQNLPRDMMPSAYEAALAIVESNRALLNASPFASAGPGISRGATVQALMKIVPYSGTAPAVPAAVPLLVRLVRHFSPSTKQHNNNNNNTKPNQNKMNTD